MTTVPDPRRLREDLRALQQAALAAADPKAAVTRALSLNGEHLVVAEQVLALERDSRVWLIALGKASCGMAQGALAAVGERITAGVVAHPHGAGASELWPRGLLRFAAGHPLPDEGSLRAGQAALEMLQHPTPRDVVLVLVSGGGSALFESLRPGITLEDLRRITEALQHSGADIVELNVVRRALSRIKGGGLARAAVPARVVALIISDVVGDSIEAIASGPTVESPTGPADALVVLDQRGLTAHSAAVTRALRAASTQSAGSGTLLAPIVRIVGSNLLAATALCEEAAARGFRTLLLTDRMQGEAREVGRFVGGVVRGMHERALPLASPACVVLGGETTVTVRGHGRGGRNLELALGAALALDGCPGAVVFSFATDGVDGASVAAGAIATGETLARARAKGLSGHRSLAENDTEAFFRALEDLWITGPSGTNVNDLVVGLSYP